VFRLNGPSIFVAGVYDLAGRKVRDLSFALERASGEHRLVWDGRNDWGRLLEPGVYLLHVGFNTDSGKAPSFTASVSLVY
jgi:hypothetical protein